MNQTRAHGPKPRSPAESKMPRVTLWGPFGVQIFRLKSFVFIEGYL